MQKLTLDCFHKHVFYRTKAIIINKNANFIMSNTALERKVFNEIVKLLLCDMFN